MISMEITLRCNFLYNSQYYSISFYGDYNVSVMKFSSIITSRLLVGGGGIGIGLPMFVGEGLFTRFFFCARSTSRCFLSTCLLARDGVGSKRSLTTSTPTSASSDEQRVDLPVVDLKKYVEATIGKDETRRKAALNEVCGM